MRFRVYVGKNGRSPFVEQFRSLDKDAAAAIVRRLSLDLRMHTDGLSLSVGKKLSGQELWQSANQRSHGNATRYLYRRYGNDVVLYGVFVKQNDADNDAAIKQADPFRIEVEADSHGVENLTDYLCIERQFGDPGRPWVARLASTDQDVGILSPDRRPDEVETAVDSPVYESRRERWRRRRDEAARRRGEVISGVLLAQEVAEATAARADARAQRRATKTLEQVSRRGHAQDLWDNPPFDLELLIKWIALEDDIAFYEATAVPEEEIRNRDGQLAFEQRRQEELEALNEGADDLQTAGPDAVGEAVERELQRQWEEMLELAGQIHEQVDEAKRIQARAVLSRGRRKTGAGKLVRTPGIDQGQLTRMRREMAGRSRTFGTLLDVVERTNEVKAETFKPSRVASRKLRDLREARDRVIAQIGAATVDAGLPAIRAALGVRGSAPKPQQKAQVTSQNARRDRLAAHVIRICYEQGLGLSQEIFSDMPTDRVANKETRSLIRDIVSHQQKTGIAVGNGLASEAAAFAVSVATTGISAR